MSTKQEQDRQWQDVICLIRNNRRNIKKMLSVEEQRIRVQFFCIYVFFALVSIGMTTINALTGWHLLCMGTLVFALVNLGNIILSLLGQRAEKLTHVLFSAEMIAMFTFLLVSGEPEGFSAIWIALLPTCGLLLYRLRFGTVIVLVQFGLLVFFCWTRIGRAFLLYPYTGTFLRRFPLLYFVLFMVGLFFEFILHITQRELAAARQGYEKLSKHDPLTGLFNRLGFFATIEEHFEAGNASGCAFSIVDFDSFKSINDNRGHNCGDYVLKAVARLIREAVGEGGCVCRWGGDEMAVFFYGIEIAEVTCNRILEAVRAHVFAFADEEFHTTISMGLASVPPNQKYAFEDVVAVADKNLYVSKSTGKDCLVASEYSNPFVLQNPSIQTQ